eukprot:GFUD01105131.1.p1 GENE.GFUD01105131.1~~GFUD01105131.1.p1  ORF type:complete len:320 (+),score=110.35 GFUD01105131.1:87-962(+)
MCQNFTNSVSKILTEIEVPRLDPSPSPQTSRPFTVLVEGNIGSGKTTFLDHFNKFSEEVEILVEPVDKWRNARGHNLLQMMYEDQDRWGLAFQTYVQLTMVQNHTKVTSKSVKLMERSLFSAMYCFVENLKNRGKMPLSEYEVLSSWFEFLLSCPQVDVGVDLIVYMRTDPEVALSRVRSRSRGEEHLISEDYIRGLHHLHEDWLVHGKHPLPAPVIVVDANKDIDEMREVFARQKEIVMRKAREIHVCEKAKESDDKENCKLAKVGSKRLASDDVEGGRRKSVLVETRLR